MYLIVFFTLNEIGFELKSVIFWLLRLFVLLREPLACKKVINCSQTKFVAIILVLSVFFYAIFRLTNFSSDAFDFSSSKTG